MSDLISRSELLEELKSLKIVLNGKQIFFDDAKDTVLRIVNELPTAYSVENVVEELEIERKTANNTYNSFNMDVDLGRVFGLEKAIEIVKQGGVADDVCEWKFEDEEANLYLTGCQQRQLIFEGTPKENGYRYCHYCGKKIKVVE